ncbi:MAG: cysteine desulfurase [Proteobacteria bacterium]|nr:cysteine desulfurase [Pseudomonadota bacterium]
MDVNPTKTAKLDSSKIKRDFPILDREVHPGVPLIYLDSAATSQKPRQVISAMSEHYQHSNANIHRGIHVLAEESTGQYEDTRQKVADFINAAKAKEIIFTRNTTESINLVAYSWARANLSSGDVIILTEMEHHSNIIPWQMLASERDVRLEFISVTDEGLLDMQSYRKLLELNPKLVAFTSMSNVLGTITPAKEIVSLAHAAGALALIDAAQAVPHFPVNVQNLDVDFMAFSSHKMCGPTGLGVLYGKQELLEAMPPFLGGGEMIKRVELRSFTTNDLPHKFEAGTPNISGAIGLGAAVSYLQAVGMHAISAHEHDLLQYMTGQLGQVDGLRLIGTAFNKASVQSFLLDDIHPHDLGTILDHQGVAIRTGHHCAMPVMDFYGVPGTARASLALYNNQDDVDRLVAALTTAKEIFR